jgi:predicted TIM-barrel fold metal-dependent hydrolase
VVSSTATVKEQVKAINSFILSAVKSYPQFTGLITLHPDNTVKEIDEEIKFALDNGLKGIKLHPDFQRFRIDDKKMYNIYSAAQGVLPILFHAGDKRFDFSSPRYIAHVAGTFKKLKCAAAHFGGYSEWESVGCFADTPNVYFDTSSSLKFLPAEEAVEIIKTLGEERFMFGTDYPMWRHDAELSRFNALALSENARRKILCENAEKFYGIE